MALLAVPLYQPLVQLTHCLSLELRWIQPFYDKNYLTQKALHLLVHFFISQTVISLLLVRPGLHHTKSAISYNPLHKQEQRLLVFRTLSVSPLSYVKVVSA